MSEKTEDKFSKDAGLDVRPPRPKDPFWEWVLQIVVLRGPLATAVGVVLEILANVAAGGLFGNLPGVMDFLMDKSFPVALGSFLVFHIVGWVICLHQWPYITREKVDPYRPIPKQDFEIEHDDMVIVGRVYRKS